MYRNRTDPGILRIVRVGHPVVAAALGGVLLLASGSLDRPAHAQLAAQAGELEVYDVVPLAPSVHIHVGERRQFSMWVRGEALRYQWLLDGGVVGERHSWTFVPQETDVGSHLVTVVVEGDEGRTSQTWKVQVEFGGEAAATTSMPPPPEPPTTSSTTTTSRPTTSTSSSTTSTSNTSSTRIATTSSSTTTRRATTTVRPTTTSPEPSTTTTSPPPPTTTTPPARAGAIGESEVRALFARYEAAWRNQDIAGLEAVGQVSTDGQMDALKSYFESVKDLEVTVTILSITSSGDEAQVRFIRRDRFRDPAGNLVTKESPVIEKRIVRTPGGLRLAPPR